MSKYNAKVDGSMLVEVCLPNIMSVKVIPASAITISECMHRQH